MKASNFAAEICSFGGLDPPSEFYLCSYVASRRILLSLSIYMFTRKWPRLF